MAFLQLANCDVGIKIAGTKYEFFDVNEVQVEDPERNSLTRGSNGKNKVGLAFKDGLKEPKKWTVPILNMSLELKAVLDSAFEDQTRVDVFVVDRKNASSKMLKEAILANRPQQLTLDDTAESLNVSLEFLGFESIEDLKE